MGLIKNKNKYPVKEMPSSEDYIIGTDSENGGKTVNFKVGTFVEEATGGGLPDEIISGTYEWIEGTLSFNIYNLSFRKNGGVYVVEDTTITFEDGVSDPRTDLAAVDTENGLVIIKGTPSPDPATPVVDDTTTQLPFFTVDIAAFATVPTDATKELIWDENTGEPTEWVASENTGGTSIQIPSTDVSNTFNNSIKFVSPSNTDRLSLVKSSTVNVNEEDTLEFYLYLGSSFNNNQRVRVQFYNGVTSISNIVTIVNNQYNFSRNTTGVWQYISIPLSSFNFSGATYDRIDVFTQNLGGSGKTFYVDTINLTKGLNEVSFGLKHSNLNLDDGTNPHGTTQSDVGLGNVDNTSDLDKPISTSTQVALSSKSDVGHTHVESEITDLDKYTQLEIDTLLSTKQGNIVDNEDISKSGDSLIISNRDSNVNGKKGYKVIRVGFDWGNIPSSYADSIWEIRDDFDLTGITVNLPTNVELLFSGGILKNATSIVFDNTVITSKSKCFENNNYSGTLYNDYFDFSWEDINSDGITDNTAIINKVLLLSKKVFLPKGDYLITQLDLNNGNVFMSEGKIISANNTIFNLNTINNVVIDFLNKGSIEGDNSNIVQEAIKIFDCTNIFIKNIKIRQCLNKGVSISGTSEYINVHDLDVKDSNSSTGVGISIFSTTTKYCYFKNLTLSDNRIGISINGGSYCNVENIIANNCLLAGMMIDGVVSNSGDGGKYNNVSNVIFNNSQSAAYGGIYLGNGASFNTIKNIQCNNGFGAGIRMQGFLATNEPYNNVFDGFTCNGNASRGINVSGSVNTIVKNGTANDNTNSGIQFFDCTNVMVSDVFVNNNSAAGLLLQSVVNSKDKNVFSTNNNHGIQIAFGGSLSPTNNRSYKPHLENNITSQYTAASGSKIFDSTGYISDNKGVNNISDGATISHGLSITPVIVNVTGSVSGEIVTVTGIGATTFTVSIKQADGTTSGTTQNIYWEASKN